MLALRRCLGSNERSACRDLFLGKIPLTAIWKIDRKEAIQETGDHFGVGTITQGRDDGILNEGIYKETGKRLTDLYNFKR